MRKLLFLFIISLVFVFSQVNAEDKPVPCNNTYKPGTMILFRNGGTSELTHSIVTGGAFNHAGIIFKDKDGVDKLAHFLGGKGPFGLGSSSDIKTGLIFEENPDKYLNNEVIESKNGGIWKRDPLVDLTAEKSKELTEFILEHKDDAFSPSKMQQIAGLGFKVRPPLLTRKPPTEDCPDEYFCSEFVATTLTQTGIVNRIRIVHPSLIPFLPPTVEYFYLNPPGISPAALAMDNIVDLSGTYGPPVKLRFPKAKPEGNKK